MIEQIKEKYMTKQKFQIKPENYGFPSIIAGMTINTISWKDFPGSPPENTWFLAYTYWVNNYRMVTGKHKKIVCPTVSIGPKAWVRDKDNFRLLQHETGHYWIACLCALQFKKRIDYQQEMPKNMTFAEWCSKVQKKTMSEFAAMQKLYDKQTYHYCIQEEQQRWQKKIIGKFNEYDRYFKMKFSEDLKNQKARNLQQNTKLANKKVSVDPKKRLYSLPQNKKVQNTKSNKIEQTNPKATNDNFKIRKVVNQKPPLRTTFRMAKNNLNKNIDSYQKHQKLENL